ncbi:unnamed protein product [Rhizophagus irregularis]|uniref:DNA-directed DNA polymerase n=1 Tax=Rhizophagus irregularis TaxID=588596 RepID=A0A2N1MGP7_9GLOM|nr:hypothetical protein RhiirC2_792807 [Rhizophagus irregularis]CAB4381104.1 unnamed protein product [Rhizophagus irregularis]CAB5369684.1 unnamed protein product [Rhizophagus irregularis]
MSSLLGSIFGTLSSLFGNFPNNSDHLVNEPLAGQIQDRRNITLSYEYDTDPISFTRWYSASRGLFYREQSQSNEVEFFDGITHWIGSKKDFSVLSQKWFFIQVDKYESLEEASKRYLDESISISHKSHGLIDMRKTGTYAATSLRLFQDVTNGPIRSTRLSTEEEFWILKASTGSIIWAEPYEGDAKQYDINEFYPSVLLQKEAQWPIKSGMFETLTFLNKKLAYGIYRVNIEGLPKKSEKQCTQLFHYNQEEFYTHYGIEIARKIGLEIKLINVSLNAYIFSQENLMDGKLLFEDWAKKLVSIKREKGTAGKAAKEILVSL